MSNLAESNNTQYHANRTHLSSSMLKLLLKDPQRFYREWVLGERNDEYNPAFVEGSLTHTLCLEPHKLAEYAIFEGARRYGRAFDEFLAKNQDRTIVTATQLEKAQRYSQACLSHPTASELLTGGIAEHTMSGTLLDIPVKARADYINEAKGYIVDVKTSRLLNDIDLFKGTCKEFGYDLSAALYCAIASQVYGKPFDFYWIVISKDSLACEVYKASSKTLREGTIAYTAAIALYKQCMQTGEWTNLKLVDNTGIYQIQEV